MLEPTQVEVTVVGPVPELEPINELLVDHTAKMKWYERGKQVFSLPGMIISFVTTGASTATLAIDPAWSQQMLLGAAVLAGINSIVSCCHKYFSSNWETYRKNVHDLQTMQLNLKNAIFDKNVEALDKLKDEAAALIARL